MAASALEVMADTLAAKPGSIMILATLFCILVGIIIFLLSDAATQSDSPTRHSPPPAVPNHNHVRKRVVSVTLDGILFSKASGNGPGGFVVHESAAEAMSSLCTASTVVAIAKVSSSDEEQTVRALVTRLKLFESGLEPHRLLFCTTDYGRGCMVRQLNPTLHFESSPDVVRNLDGKGVNISLVAPPSKKDASARGDSPSEASGLAFAEALSILNALGVSGPLN